MPTYEITYKRTTVETIVNRISISEGQYTLDEMDEVGRDPEAWTVSQAKETETVEFVRSLEVTEGPVKQNVVLGSKRPQDR